MSGRGIIARWEPMTFEIGDWQIRLRVWRWIYVVVLATIAYQLAGWDVVLLVLLASVDIEMGEKRA